MLSRPRLEYNEEDFQVLNSGNKIKALEALWAATIVATRIVCIAHGILPKERENAKVPSKSWKVGIRMAVVILSHVYVFEQSFVSWDCDMILWYSLQSLCDVMVNKFYSIDMKSTTTKLILKLKRKLHLICYAKET